MSPPEDDFVNNGALSNFPSCDYGSQSGTGNPMMIPFNVMQLQASQQNSLQQPQLKSVYTGTQGINPNQHIVVTTTTTQMPTQVSQSQAPIPQSQTSMPQATAFGAPNANEAPPFLMSDPKVFLQAYQQKARAFQQNARALQQHARALQQAQMQFTNYSQPSDAMISNQTSQSSANALQQNAQALQQAQMQFTNYSQQPDKMVSIQTSQADANANARALQQNAQALQQAQMQFTNYSQPPDTMVSNQTSHADANANARALQQNAQALQQAQMQFKKYSQPPDTMVSNQTSQADANANARALQQNGQALQQAEMQFTNYSQQPDKMVSNQTSQADVSIPMQQCVKIINQALQHPQYAAAGQVLLQAMQSSSTYINSLMNRHQKFPQSHEPKTVESQDTIKTCVPNQEPSSKYMNSVMDPPQKFVQVDEPKTEVHQDTIKTFIPNQESSSTYMFSLMNQPRKSVYSDESKPVLSPDTIETCVPNQVFWGGTLEHVEREDTHEMDSEEEMWKLLLTCSDEGGLDTSYGSTLVPSVSSSNFANLMDSLSPVETQPPQHASPVKSSMQNHPSQPLPPLSLNNAPVLHKQAKVPPARANCGKVNKPRKPRKKNPIVFEFQGSPQKYLMAILKERGYSTDHIPNSESGYQSGPTPLRLASFGTQVVKAVNEGDVSKLSALLECGLSPSPCNSFGDFIVHLVCKRANVDILQCLLDHGCSLEVCDNFGRTPLHCVAWAGKFCSRTAELILDTNWNQILIADNHGRCPLDYVRKQDFPIWIEFLRSKMDAYWPIGGVDRKLVPPIKREEEVDTISLDLVSDIANGFVDPEAFVRMDESMRRHYTKGNPNCQ